MKKNQHKNRDWILPAVLILFVLTGITFPWAAGITYSWRSESPDRTLTYTPGELVWDRGGGIRADGSAELSLFQTLYQNVKSEDGAQVAAPGAHGENTIRLISKASGTVKYTAVAYQIKSGKELPIKGFLTAKGAKDAPDAVLPKGVKPSQVIRTLQGTLPGNGLQEFQIGWTWEYHEGKEQDLADTALGDKAAFDKADDILIGFTIILEDENGYVTPRAPKTGDNINFKMWLILLSASLFTLLLLLFIRGREKEVQNG